MDGQTADAAGPPAPPLIEAKLAQPRRRPGIVLRPRLFRALDRLSDVELTLLSASAGAGKTMLVASWLALRPDLACAWVTLDAGDDDPAQLWTYVAHAVDRVRPGIARPALARLRMPRAPVETAIDELLNGLRGCDGRITIVLDDLHHATSESAMRSLIYAIERLPGTTRVVATTRSDPTMRLSRLRASGALGELRASELAFTVAEARELLVDTAGIDVGDADVKRLVQRTEGWPAGISLAALWLTGLDAPREGVEQFSGDHRHVADYLTSEVLDALDDEARAFLVRSSVFGRFSAAVCDAALGTTDAARRLAELAHSNLFLIALDARGTWYRYHHLFRELLRTELARTHPEEVAELHRRAAAWFAEHGLVEEALEHAAEIGEPSALAEMLMAEHLTLIRTGAMDVLMAWIDRLPSNELARRPALAGAAALVAGMLGQPAAKRRRLARVAESGLEHLPDREANYARAFVEVSRAALLDTDLGVVLGHARTAAELSRQADELAVGALAVKAYALLLDGDTSRAREAADEALARPEARQRPHGLIFAHGVHALLDCDAGRPHAAEAEARHALALAREFGLTDILAVGIAHHAAGCALLRLGHARDAERELDRADILRRAPEPRLDHAHSLLALADARIARGRLTLARSELDAAREQIDAFADAGVLPDMAAEVERRLDDALAGAQHTVEAPSAAELAVLRLLASDLSQREIGGRLFLSMNTIKSHTRSLYLKLGVNSREAAVQQASALGLIETGDSPR